MTATITALDPVDDRPHQSVQLIPWTDPVVEAHGHDPRSVYCETFWLPVLGPTSLWLLRRTATLLERWPDGITVDVGDLAGQLGVQPSQLRATLNRLTYFRIAERGVNVWRIRTRLGPVPTRLQRRLPASLLALHVKRYGQ